MTRTEEIRAKSIELAIGWFSGINLGMGMQNQGPWIPDADNFAETVERFERYIDTGRFE